MGFLEAVQTCLAKYVTFSGRALRSEYWYFFLFTLLAGVVAALIDYAFSMSAIARAVNYAFLVPTVAAGARRLHDIGLSGWWQALVLPPVGIAVFAPWIGNIGLLLAIVILGVMLAWRGRSGPNRFGPDPLNPTDARIFA